MHTARKATRLATQIHGPKVMAHGWRSMGGLYSASWIAIDPTATGHH